ncbi:hypothetical protein G6009_00910 [Dietzia sp. SLG510A3-30A2]|nr:hypothetical protein [Dietzia sp. SLG510A3-30A2]
MSALETLAAELERKDKLTMSLLAELDQARRTIARYEHQREADLDLIMHLRNLVEMPAAHMQVAA